MNLEMIKFWKMWMLKMKNMCIMYIHILQKRIWKNIVAYFRIMEQKIPGIVKNKKCLWNAVSSWKIWRYWIEIIEKLGWIGKIKSEIVIILLNLFIFGLVLISWERGIYEKDNIIDEYFCNSEYEC